MQVFSYINLPSDQPFWIPRSAFLTQFDQHDFNAYRDVANVAHAYRRDWFYKREKRLEFILPVVSFVRDKTQFINGRHRTAVLLNYLPELPLALASILLSPNHVKLKGAISKRPLDQAIPFELPELPFLPDSGETEEY